eukprot:gene6843-9368_t
MLPDRNALITPYYPLSLAKFVGTIDKDANIVNIAMCVTASLWILQNKNMCHGDIKPNNLMFTNNDNVIVCIDLGIFIMFDRVCLAVTLSEMIRGDSGVSGIAGRRNISLKTMFLDYVFAKHGNNVSKEIIRILLDEKEEIKQVWDYLLTLLQGDAALERALKLLL